MQQLDFALIDAHIHQWDPYNTPHAAATAVKLLGKHPYLLDKMIRMLQPKDLLESVGLTTHITAPYLPQHYKKDVGRYAVEQVVHVEAHWHNQKGKGVIGETQFIESLPFNHESVALGAIVAAADPSDSNFKKILKLHQQASPRMRGIRKIAAKHEDSMVHAWTPHSHLYSQTNFLKGFEALAEANLSFDAWVYSAQIRDVTNLARQFPETSIVLDHLGTPVGAFGQVGANTGLTQTARDNILFRWKDDIAELASCPNVYSKMSGLFMPVLGHRFHKQNRLASKQEVLDLALPLISHALNSFGQYRLMFASNFPMDSVSTSLVNIIDAFSDIVAAYHPDAVEHVFHHNAKTFYRL